MLQNFQLMDQSILLKTIKMPKQLLQSEDTQFWNDLSQRLPKPNYDRLSLLQHQDSQQLTHMTTVNIEDCFDLSTHRSSAGQLPKRK